MTNDYLLFRANLEMLVAHVGTPEKLAVRAGIPYHTILNWRRRGTRPSIGNAVKLAESFYLTLGDLLESKLSRRDFPRGNGK